jgi:transposase
MLGWSRVSRCPSWVNRVDFAMSALGPLTLQQQTCCLAIDLLVLGVIQAPKAEHRFMRYELSDCEWGALTGASGRIAPENNGLADRGYDADWIRAFIAQQGAWGNIPPKVNRNDPIYFSPHLERARNLVERFFNKIKQCRRIATRSSPPITSPSSSLPRSAFGCALMCPRPSFSAAISLCGQV